VRYRRSVGGQGSSPEYPPVALAIDYLVPPGFEGALTLEILDAQGRVVRAISSGSGGGGRGPGTAVSTTPGHHRLLWDYRWSDDGPLGAPGKYTARLGSSSRTFEVLPDPAVIADGITVADLVDQQEFLLRVRDAQRGAQRLRDRIRDAMAKASVPLPPAPGPGERIAGMTYAHPLQELWSRVARAPGIYQQGMLIEQLGNILRAEGGADQNVGTESRRRFDDLLSEMRSIEADLQRLSQR
jgi:hypothetical protein